MKSLSDLIFEDNAWLMINNWIHESDKDIVILDNERRAGEEALYQLQITNRSTMGAIALECGGLVIDHGWLYILGSGNVQIYGSLKYESLGFPFNEGLVVAYDVVGRVYAINKGNFDKSSRNIFYFAPDTLSWEDTGKGYTDFFYWALHGDLDNYYDSFRWSNWRVDVKKLSSRQGFSIYPYLWTKEGKDINNCSKKSVSLKEIWELQDTFRNELEESL
jgi:hypothetical protein